MEKGRPAANTVSGERSEGLTPEKRRVLARARWDLNLTPEQVLAIIKGSAIRKWSDRGFSVARLLESAGWFEISEIVQPEEMCGLWGKARRYVRSNFIREGMDFACRILR